MKRVLLAAEALADEPLAEHQDRTPLEIAKAPVLSDSAMKGRVGSTVFAPRKLPAGADVACFSLLGYDPLEFYTGIAPLEALAWGIPQRDDEVAFRCDLVTVLDETLVDATAGHISTKEMKIFADELNRAAGSGDVRFHALDGHRMILMVRQESLDDLELAPATAIVGDKLDRHLPSSRAYASLLEIFEKARAVLEPHEINRVRVDLGENPANRIWLWGQGKRPAPVAFERRFGVNGAVHSAADFARGLGRALGLSVADKLAAAIAANDFVFSYLPKEEGEAGLKGKISRIERLESAFCEALEAVRSASEWRICVATDTVSPIGKEKPTHGKVPFFVCGTGIEAENRAFNERQASQSAFGFEDGHRMMEWFLKQ